MDEKPSDDGQRPSPSDVIALDFALTPGSDPLEMYMTLAETLTAYELREPFGETLGVLIELVAVALESGQVEVKAKLETGEPSILNLEVLDSSPEELVGDLRDRIEALTGGAWSRKHLDGGHLTRVTVRRTRGERPQPD